MRGSVKAPGSPAHGPVAIALAGGLVIHHGRSELGSADLRSRRAEVAFARLAIDARRTVSRHALADAVWDEQRPVSWESALRTAIATARRWLTAGGLDGLVAIETAGDGYRLALTPGSEWT